VLAALKEALASTIGKLLQPQSSLKLPAVCPMAISQCLNLHKSLTVEMIGTLGQLPTNKRMALNKPFKPPSIPEKFWIRNLSIIQLMQS
jgi:hypothetical protein